MEIVSLGSLGWSMLFFACILDSTPDEEAAGSVNERETAGRGLLTQVSDDLLHPARAFVAAPLIHLRRVGVA